MEDLLEKEVNIGVAVGGGGGGVKEFLQYLDWSALGGS